ncbi:MAG: hypothetical protein V4581_19020 [Bacteroidota bacterium]
MKKTMLLFGLCAIFASCSDDDNSDPVNVILPVLDANKVLALKVDLLTNTFEGGKVLEFEGPTDTFTISADYNVPGDFGDITLKYNEVDANLFEGTIHWMGLGEITYPSFELPNAFAAIDNETAMPAANGFEFVSYGSEFGSPSPYYEENADLAAIWDAVDNLQLVKDYRITNPNAKVQLFLYTPSVGVGNPAEWDWIIFLKN